MALLDKSITEIRAFLARPPAPEEIIEFRLPEKTQRRISRLLLKNNMGTITQKELAEIDRFLDLEHEFRMAKARARLALMKQA